MRTLWVTAFLFLFGCLQLVAWASPHPSAISPVGLWQTLDDATQSPRSVVKIWQQDGKLHGKIVKIYFREGENKKDVCRLCVGKLHNQPMIGLNFMWGFIGANLYWQDGRIVDPKTGKTYQSKLTLSDDGNRLYVRGFIGLPVFGRSQVWQRVSHD